MAHYTAFSAIIAWLSKDSVPGVLRSLTGVDSVADERGGPILAMDTTTSHMLYKPSWCRLIGIPTSSLDTLHKSCDNEKKVTTDILINATPTTYYPGFHHACMQTVHSLCTHRRDALKGETQP